MQGPQYVPFPQDYYHAAHGQNMYPVVPEHRQYLETGGVNYTGFSRGSSLPYPHEECHYFPDRGDPSGLSSSSLARTSLSATGLAITGDPSSRNNAFLPEEITDYQQQQWQWLNTSVHGLPAHPLPTPTDFSTIKSTVEHGSVLSPAAQLPTPVSMAILLNPNSRSEVQCPQPSFQPPAARLATQATTARQAHPTASEVMASGVPEGLSREKKHGCTMCHKRFDRPSTLRKHLLVHTGEKAFVCETCGRRFGVASNLNRHVRRCILKPVNTALTSATASISISPSVGTISLSSATDRQESTSGSGNLNKRTRVNPSPPSNTSSSCSSDHAESPQQSQNTMLKSKSPTQKRRRRAPSPSQWIPYSLLSFNLMPPESQKATSVPLPPVKRNLPREERDSWDENVGSSPYHPCGWRNVLPGPGLGLGLGLGGKDVGNLNLGGSGGFMLGRVLVF